ncbi:MAG: hypothetical protein U5L06_03580 [Rhodovibrio sp.]|nr:hypothetical protein [Rhodovibrio sp.]
MVGSSHPADPARDERGLQTVLGQVDQRADQPRFRHLALVRHPGETVQPALSLEAQQHRLRPVGAVVAEGEVQDALLCADGAQPVVPLGPGVLLTDPLGPVALPADDPVRDLAFGQQRADKARLRRGFRAQAVVDRDRQHLAAPGRRPVGQQQRQRQAVRPAGDGRRHRGRRLERREGVHARGELGRGDGRGVGHLRRRP